MAADRLGISAVLALATSVDGTVVAAARENGFIELWNVEPGSDGWEFHLTFPGKEEAAISSLVWCKSGGDQSASLGRLFSAQLDGSITEWNLQTFEPKETVESYGGSVWQMAAEPLEALQNGASTSNGSLHRKVGDRTDNDESSSSEDEEEEGSADQDTVEQRIAVGCDDGCIRCWDSTNIRELFRITAGIGGRGSGSELCVWSLLALRNGTLVSGDSTGSTQFWDGQQGTLLAAATSKPVVFPAGPLGQVTLYQVFDESWNEAADESNYPPEKKNLRICERWVYVGYKRNHSHDVKALALAHPVVQEGQDERHTRTRGHFQLACKNLLPACNLRPFCCHNTMAILLISSIFE